MASRAVGRAVALALAGMLFSPFSLASAQTADLRVGIIAPEDGIFEILGDQVRTALAAFASSQEGRVEIVHAPESCEADDGDDAAFAMAEAGVDAVIGMFCMETARDALPVLAESGIPALTISLRAGILMEDALSAGWPLFRLAVDGETEARAIADAIARLWSGNAIALIDDGTIYGRDLSETVRLNLEEMGMAASFIDNYRPAEELQFGLVRRLAAAGITHVFVGGDRADVAIMARDAAEAGLDLTFMGGDAMLAADGDIPLADGVLAVVAMPQAGGYAGQPTGLASGRYAEASASIDRVIQASDTPDMRASDGYHLAAYAAGEVLAQAQAQAESSGQALGNALVEGTFTTALGDVRFGTDQHFDSAIFTAVVWQDGRFSAIGAGVSE